MKVILTLFCRPNKPEHINYYNFPLDLLSTLQNYAQKFSGIELLIVRYTNIIINQLKCKMDIDLQ